MPSDIDKEVTRLLSQGKSTAEVRIDLEQQGFASDAIASALENTSTSDSERMNRKTSKLLATRDVFDRIGYGAATPQIVNILFYLSAQTWPYILFLIGILNGLKTLLSVIWSNILQEYDAIHKVGRDLIAKAGIIYGFSFLILSFALMGRNLWLFSLIFLIGTVGIVAYGDLYGRFIEGIIRRERMGWFLRSIAHWGVLITAATLIATGLLLDIFPMTGTMWSFTLAGHVFTFKLYGYLLAFEITAFAFILSGYVTSFIGTPAAGEKYSLWTFIGEHLKMMRAKAGVFWQSTNTRLLTLSSIALGLVQIIITAYSGIAIYKILAQQYDAPFFALAIVYAIAIIAAFTGPFFTQTIHRATGLAPTLVFGSILMAILPLVLAMSTHIAAIAVALCLNVIGAAIVGFGQGLLSRKLLPDAQRHDFFRAQSFVITIPYLVLVPILAWVANSISLKMVFLIAAGGLLLIVMPILFSLVVVSQHQRL